MEGRGGWSRAAGNPPGGGCAALPCVQRCRAFLPGRGGGSGTDRRHGVPAREMTGKVSLHHGRSRPPAPLSPGRPLLLWASTEAAAGTPLPLPGIPQAAPVWASKGSGEPRTLPLLRARPLPAGVKEGCGRDSVGARLPRPCFPTSPSQDLSRRQQLRREPVSPVSARGAGGLRGEARDGVSEGESDGVSGARPVTGSQGRGP